MFAASPSVPMMISLPFFGWAPETAVATWVAAAATVGAACVAAPATAEATWVAPAATVAPAPLGALVAAAVPAELTVGASAVAVGAAPHAARRAPSAGPESPSAVARRRKSRRLSRRSRRAAANWVTSSAAGASAIRGLLSRSLRTLDAGAHPLEKRRGLWFLYPIIAVAPEGRNFAGIHGGSSEIPAPPDATSPP